MQSETVARTGCKLVGSAPDGRDVSSTASHDAERSRRSKLCVRRVMPRRVRNLSMPIATAGATPCPPAQSCAQRSSCSYPASIASSVDKSIVRRDPS
eukprot:4111072-Pleurochrysis_carterae.AAC.3